METVKNPVCIVLVLCSALMACNRENPKTPVPVAPLSKDPVDLLRSLETAKGFDHALIQERLWLTKEAIHSWNEVVQEKSDRSTEARQHLERLQRLPDPASQWNPEEVRKAVELRDANALTRIALAFPVDTAQSFEFYIGDRDGARLYAKVLAATGEHYPQSVVDAMERTPDRAALEQGLAAFKTHDYQRAATLLERANNPLHLAARYDLVVTDRTMSIESRRRVLDMAIPHLRPEYRELSSRIHMFRANLLEFDDRYLEAHADYARALTFTNGEPTSTVAILGRRSLNYGRIGAPEAAFRDAHRAMSLLDRVADTNARNTAYGSATIAARQLGYPLVALHYQNAAVETAQRAVFAKINPRAKLELAVALRARAEIHVALGQHADAEGDLEQAADLAEAAEHADFRDLLRMRVREVRGQMLMKSRPAEGVASFNEAIALATEEDSTYRAILHFQRAAARRSAGDPHAGNDIATAQKLLREEVRRALTIAPQRASESLWTPYFSRFQARYDELIESRIEANAIEDAFVHSELARAFEPMQILLQSRSGPAGLRPIETVSDLRKARAILPEDTAILQFLVLPGGTYTWVVTRERIELVPQRATEKDVEGWTVNALESAAARQSDPFIRAMRAAYGELFRAPLTAAGASKTRVVIVPDGPMLGFPFNGLVGTTQEGYLIERASIAVAGSTSAYLYALARDQQLSGDRNPSVLLVGDPAFISKMFPRLPYAKEEVKELSAGYSPGAETLVDAEATVPKFLAAVKNKTIVHFAGHGIASPQEPWQSRLLFAPHGGASGELSAQKLMLDLPKLERTRLVVLGACSSAGGGSVGPQGLAPLVRPFIAANVPAVVGAMWNVGDASAKQLLVSLHCHYRHGDDVAVALRNAQLERLRDEEPAMAWAAFQVVGHAGSPYPLHRTGGPNIEHLCTQNSLLRFDGLPSQ